MRVLPLVVASVVLAGCDRSPSQPVPAPRTIRVAAIQLACRAGSVERQSETAHRLIRAAAARGARYILLPELHALFPAACALAPAEEVRAESQSLDGPLTTGMLALARELDVHLAYGMVERRGDKLYNSVVLVSPKGVTGAYGKRALVKLGPPGRTEADLFTGGVDRGQMDWNGLRTGVLICADSGFDAYWQEAGQGAQLVLWPKSSIGQRSDRALEWARRLGVPVVVANPAFPEHEMSPMFGGSRIVAADGTDLAHAGDEPDTIIVADVTLPR